MHMEKRQEDEEGRGMGEGDDEDEVAREEERRRKAVQAVADAAHCPDEDHLAQARGRAAGGEVGNRNKDAIAHVGERGSE